MHTSRLPSMNVRASAWSGGGGDGSPSSAASPAPRLHNQRRCFACQGAYDGLEHQVEGAWLREAAGFVGVGTDYKCTIAVA